jgi:hypothetical protein
MFARITHAHIHLQLHTTPGTDPAEVEPGKGYLALLETLSSDVDRPVHGSTRFLEMNLPFGQCAPIGTGAIQLISCSETSMQFAFCANSTNCSCGFSAVRDEFTVSGDPNEVPQAP